MHPSFEQFIDALRNPALRPSMRLEISDDDAARLLSNDAWVRDYFAKWTALFPASPDTVPTRPRRPRAGPVLVLGGLITACLAVAVVALAIPHPPGAIVVVGDNQPRASASASASSSNPAGLTAAALALLNAELAVSGSSVDKLIADGTTDAKLKELAALETGLADVTCVEVDKAPKGFDTTGAEDTFVAGLEKGFTILGKTVTATKAQAEAVWTAMHGYCTSTKAPSPSATP